MLSHVKIGKKLYISLNRDGKTFGQNDELISQLAGHLSKNEFIISAPMYKESIFRLDMGDALSVTYTHDGGVYTLKCQVQDAVTEQDFIFYKLTITSEIERVQRREHFRLSLHEPIIYHKLDSQKDEYGQGITKDLSGGGLKFISHHKFTTGDMLNIFLKVDTDLELRTAARVTRSLYFEDEKYETCVLFCQLDNRQREELIKNIFELQRKMIKMRK